MRLQKQAEISTNANFPVPQLVAQGLQWLQAEFGIAADSATKVGRGAGYTAVVPALLSCSSFAVRLSLAIDSLSVYARVFGAGKQRRISMADFATPTAFKNGDNPSGFTSSGNNATGAGGGGGFRGGYRDILNQSSDPFESGFTRCRMRSRKGIGMLLILVVRNRGKTTGAGCVPANRRPR